MKPGEIVGHIILNMWKKFDAYNWNRMKVTAHGNFTMAKVVKTGRF